MQADLSARSFLPQTATPSYYRHLIDDLLFPHSTKFHKYESSSPDQNKLENCLHME